MAESDPERGNTSLNVGGWWLSWVMDHPTPTLNTAPAGTAPDGAVMGHVEDAILSIARVDADAVDALAGEALLCFTAALEVLGRRVDALRVAAATTVNRLSDPVLGATGLAQSVGFRGGVEVLKRWNCDAPGLHEGTVGRGGASSDRFDRRENCSEGHLRMRHHRNV